MKACFVWALAQCFFVNLISPSSAQSLRLQELVCTVVKISKPTKFIRERTFVSVDEEWYRAKVSDSLVVKSLGQPLTVSNVKLSGRRVVFYYSYYVDRATFRSEPDHGYVAYRPVEFRFELDRHTGGFELSYHLKHSVKATGQCVNK